MRCPAKRTRPLDLAALQDAASHGPVLSGSATPTRVRRVHLIDRGAPGGQRQRAPRSRYQAPPGPWYLLLAARLARRAAAAEWTPRLAVARRQVRTVDEAEVPRRSVAGSWVAW